MRFLAAALLIAALPQSTSEPVNDRPNPYQTVENFFKLPNGRTWGSTSAVDVDKDGKSIWVGERCGVNSCADPETGKMSPLDPVLKFDASGKLVKSFGAGMIAFAHGIHVDRDGNIWVTDANDNRPRPARGAAPGTPAPPAPARLVGHQVIKFSPEGKVLMTLGKAGVAGNPPEGLTEPNDVVTAPNGDIFVAEGHSGQNANATPGSRNSPRTASSSNRGASSDRRLASSARRTASPSIRAAGCSSPIAATCVCRSSIRTASSFRRPRCSAA